jgi:haloalkane dehalogenase
VRSDRVHWIDHPEEDAMTIPILRTPEERFEKLPGFPFAPHYTQVTGPTGESIRVHYVDEGPRDAAPVLLLHGEPTWSFLYRKVIPVLVAAGHRAIAPDLVGFGRSDKLADRTAYTVDRHIEWLHELVRALDLRDVTLVCQDWGGPVGLGVLAAEPERFARVLATNTILPTCEPELTEGVLEWRSDALITWMLSSQRMPVLPVGPIVASACVRPVADDVRGAYDAPFPDESYKAAARQFPILIPLTTSDPAALRNRATWDVLERFERPFLTAPSDGDPLTRGWDEIFRRRVPGAAGQPHTTLQRGGHFVQEDCGEELAELLVKFLHAK